MITLILAIMLSSIAIASGTALYHRSRERFENAQALLEKQNQVMRQSLVGSAPRAIEEPNPVVTIATSSPVFSAWTHCGKCGSYDVHGVREPIKPPPPKIDTAHPGRPASRDTLQGQLVSRIETHSWGVPSAVRVDETYNTPSGLDESKYDVIRTCNNCNHEWGQT